MTTLSVKGIAIAFGLLWGGCILIVGLANMAAPPYGSALLELSSSVYPGYHGPDGVGSVVVGTLYALVDGLIGGAIFAWLYNRVA